MSKQITSDTVERILNELTDDDDKRGRSHTLTKLFGSHCAAELYSYFVHWCKKSNDGWCWRTVEQIEDRIGWTKHEQQQGRKILRDMGVLDEKSVGLPKRNYYRVNAAVLVDLLTEYVNDPAHQWAKKRPLESEKAPAGEQNTPHLIGIGSVTGSVTGSVSMERGAVAPSSLRGSRIPKGWFPNEAGMLFAAEQGLSNDAIQLEIDQFWDYWTAQPGQKGVKLDWNATWRNWVRRSKTFTKSSSKKSGESDPERAASIKRALMGWSKE